jgi:hypothetical protein
MRLAEPPQIVDLVLYGVCRQRSPYKETDVMLIRLRPDYLARLPAPVTGLLILSLCWNDGCTACCPA